VFVLTATQLERIVSRFEVQENGCWHHPSVPTAKGYAQTKYGWPAAKSVLIHRLSWMYYKGEIPEGMVVDHLCHNPAECEGGNNCPHRRCVNPEHLTLVTQLENTLRSVRIYEYRTECVNGHSTKDNIGKTISGRRYCIPCNKEQKNEHYLKLKNDPKFKARRAKNMRDLRAKQKVRVS
jgi:hypothetical protein